MSFFPFYPGICTAHRLNPSKSLSRQIQEKKVNHSGISVLYRTVWQEGPVSAGTREAGRRPKKERKERGNDKRRGLRWTRSVCEEKTCVAHIRTIRVRAWVWVCVILVCECVHACGKRLECGKKWERKPDGFGEGRNINERVWGKV